MIGVRSARRFATRVAVLAMVASLSAVASAAAQDTVSVEVPLFVSFQVTDVSVSTNGSPNPTTVSFSSASLSPGKTLRVSVQSDAGAFTPPRGASIPVSKLSWTTAAASGGIGINGTLSSSSYALVFQSDPGRTSGQVDLAWALAAPGGGIRAGSHQVTIRWKFESIAP